VVLLRAVLPAPVPPRPVSDGTGQAQVSGAFFGEVEGWRSSLPASEEIASTGKKRRSRNPAAYWRGNDI